MLEGDSFSEYPSEAFHSGSFQDAALCVLAGFWVGGGHCQVGAVSGKDGSRLVKGGQCSECWPGPSAGLRGMRATCWRRIRNTVRGSKGWVSYGRGKQRYASCCEHHSSQRGRPRP